MFFDKGFAKIFQKKRLSALFVVAKYSIPRLFEKHTVYIFLKIRYNIGYKYPKVDSLVAQRYNKKTSEMTEEEYNTILNEFKRIVDAKNKVGA